MNTTIDKSIITTKQMQGWEQQGKDTEDKSSFSLLSDWPVGRPWVSSWLISSWIYEHFDLLKWQVAGFVWGQCGIHHQALTGWLVLWLKQLKNMPGTISSRSTYSLRFYLSSLGLLKSICSNFDRVIGLLITTRKGPLKGSLGSWLPYFCSDTVYLLPATGWPRNSLYERREVLASSILGQLRPSPLPWPWIQSSLYCWTSLLCLIHPCFLGRDIIKEEWRKLKPLYSWTASRSFAKMLR